MTTSLILIISAVESCFIKTNISVHEYLLETDVTVG